MSWPAQQRRATSLILSTFDKHCQLSPLCENDSTRLLSDFTRLVQGPTQKVLFFINRALSHWWGRWHTNSCQSLSFRFLCGSQKYACNMSSQCCLGKPWDSKAAARATVRGNTAKNIQSLITSSAASSFKIRCSGAIEVKSVFILQGHTKGEIIASYHKHKISICVCDHYKTLTATQALQIFHLSDSVNSCT